MPFIKFSRTKNFTNQVPSTSSPKQIWNWRIISTMFIIGTLGASRGADEGIISGIEGQKEWLKLYGITNGSSAQSNVVSMVQLGCVLGSLLAFFCVDWFGRLRTCQLCTIVWIIGTTIWITSTQGGPSGLSQMYAGRFIAGTGIGGTSVCVPTFLSEVAPKARRGMAVNIFAFSVYIGIVIGYFANYGSQRHIDANSSARWRIPVSINFIFADLSFLGSLIVKESPRWLLKRGKEDQAKRVLLYYRQLDEHHPYFKEEFDSMLEQHDRERQESHGNVLAGLSRLFTSSSQLYRLVIVGILVQILSNWSGGGGSLTIYAPKLLNLVGVHSNSSLFTTAIFGIVKLLSAMCAAFFLIDKIGRRKSVFIGISLQCIAAIYLSAYLGIVKDPLDGANSASHQHAGIAAIVAIFIAGIGWTLGFNAISYLIGTEIFPSSTRALATTIIMIFHFVNQYGASRALQPMLHSMNGVGLFAFNASVCFISIIYVAIFIPETSGRSLEEMESLFRKPWQRSFRTRQEQQTNDIEWTMQQNNLQQSSEYDEKDSQTKREIIL